MKKYQNFINFLLPVIVTVIMHIVTDWSFIYLCFIFLIANPWKIENNLYSIFGGINMDGNIFSVLSIFQIAQGYAASVFTCNIVQLSEHKDSICFIGINMLQFAPNGNAYCFFGANIFQGSAEFSFCLIGFNLLQIADEMAFCGLGINLFQTSAKKSYCYLGINGYQNSGEESVMLIGFAAVQKSCTESCMGFGISLFQLAPKTGFQFARARNLI